MLYYLFLKRTKYNYNNSFYIFRIIKVYIIKEVIKTFKANKFLFIFIIYTYYSIIVGLDIKIKK